MVEPITLGAIVAALVAKALARGEDEAVDAGAGAVRKVLTALRGRFSRDGDKAGSAALELVAEDPGKESRVGVLAEVIAERATASEELRRDLEALVADVREAGVDVDSIAQTAIGNQNVLNAGVTGSEIKVNFGPQPPGGD